MVADPLRGKFAKIGSLMDGAEQEVLATWTPPMIAPSRGWSAAMRLEQSDEWALQRGYMLL